MMEAIMAQVGWPVVATAVVALGTFFLNARTQSTLLSQNIKSTEALSGAVNELRIQLTIFGERYVTRDEMDRKIREVFHGS